MTFAAVNGVQLAVFIFLFGFVTVLGFVAANQPYGDDATEPSDYVLEAGDPGVEPLRDGAAAR